MAKVVVVFDFDRTIIDGDSDNWVVTQMGLTRLFQELISTMPWHSLMNRMMEELHLRGKTIEDIAGCLKQMPLDPHISSAIKSAHSMGCDLRLVSDANQFFIETILKQHQLLGYFTEIITNPTLVDNGRLRIVPYHDFRLPPHGCTHCPSNMCKGLLEDNNKLLVATGLFGGFTKNHLPLGMILECIQESAGEKGDNMFIYLGDGGGDYCPTLRLRKDDHIMPRKGFPLWGRIQSNPSFVQAKIHEWSSGEELERILNHLINGVLIDGNKSNCTSNVSNLTENNSVQKTIVSTVD